MNSLCQGKLWSPWSVQMERRSVSSVALKVKKRKREGQIRCYLSHDTLTLNYKHHITKKKLQWKVDGIHFFVFKGAHSNRKHLVTIVWISTSWYELVCIQQVHHYLNNAWGRLYTWAEYDDCLAELWWLTLMQWLQRPCVSCPHQLWLVWAKVSLIMAVTDISLVL